MAEETSRDTVDLSLSKIDNKSILKQVASEKLVLEDGSIVMLGLPSLRPDGLFIVPEVPHIFEADMTLVAEGAGTAVSEAMQRGVLRTIPIEYDKTGTRRNYLNLGKTVVIFGHGVNVGTADGWFFSDTQKVPSVVRSYNAYADKNNLAKIELISACNADPGEVDLETGEVIDEELNKVRVGAFGEVIGSGFSIAYAVGEKAQGAGRVGPNGEILFVFSTKNGIIFNLANLISIKELPRETFTS